MNHGKLTIAALTLAAALTACSSSKTEVAVSCSIELPGTVDSDAFAANVESISVVNLQLDDDWAFLDGICFGLSDNYIYMIDDRQLLLTCHDRKTGEKLASRPIKGNGPGEINYFKSIFCIEDTLCIYDVKGQILQYDHGCDFLGKMHEFNNLNTNYSIVRLKNGNYAFVLLSNPSTDTASTILLADKSFNITSWYLNVPQVKISMAGGYDCYLNNDTISLIPAYNNKLYTFYEGKVQCAELAVPNPITAEVANDLISRDQIYDDLIMQNYDGFFYSLNGSGRFLTINYSVDNEYYMSAIDKRTNKAVSVPIDGYDDLKQATDIISGIVKRLFGPKSDNGFIYSTSKIGLMWAMLEGHDDILDARLQKTKDEFHAYLERNGDYIKGLAHEEIYGTNILLKIKLKD